MELGVVPDRDIDLDQAATEIVERKGSGHPDTLADRIAERVSQKYSSYCLDEFGVIPHHNADKTALLGGRSVVSFGGGHLAEPVLALVNGRFSASYAGAEIPVVDLIETAAREVFAETLVHFDVARDLRITCRNNRSSSPGHVTGGSGQRARWFAPAGPADITPADRPHANDTSCGVGYAPTSALERFVLALEDLVRKHAAEAVPNSVGSDVKIMAARHGARLQLTLAVPIIDAAVSNLADYRAVLDHVRTAITAEAIERGYLPTVIVNARDKPEIPELYLTVTGSSIESGDEGVVGRGNRCNGLITPMRSMSIEGACGKNPVYHVGKLYNILAGLIAARLYESTGRHAQVALVSTTGAPITEPGFVSVIHSGTAAIPEVTVRAAIDEAMATLPEIRDQLITGKLSLF
jgi:S-adenosylmethionine synthetase